MPPPPVPPRLVLAWAFDRNEKVLYRPSAAPNASLLRLPAAAIQCHLPRGVVVHETLWFGFWHNFWGLVVYLRHVRVEWAKSTCEKINASLQQRNTTKRESDTTLPPPQVGRAKQTSGVRFLNERKKYKLRNIMLYLVQ